MKNKLHNLKSDKLDVKDTNKNSYNSPNGTTIKKMKSEHVQKVLLTAKSLKIDAKESLEPPQIALELYNIKTSSFAILGTLGNFSLITGKAKSKKTFYINIVVSAAVSQDTILKRFKSDLPQEQNEVLYFDTEQSRHHVQLALKRICKQINIDEPKNLHVYSLRSKTPLERLEIIEALIYDNAKIGFVVIDGIKDLVTSINDEEQATLISSKLLKWTEERNLHIVTVLHQNKGNTNARGHLGTELINKAETVLSITKDTNDPNISLVEPQQCRNLEPESIAFEIIDGLPSIVENYVLTMRSKKPSSKKDDLNDSQIQSLLNLAFKKNNSSFIYSKLINQLILSYKQIFNSSIGRNKTVDLITYCKDKNWVLQIGKKKPYTLGKF